MSNWLFLFDGIVVSVFGSVLSASFCDCLSLRRKRLLLYCYMIVTLLLQGLISFFYGFDLLRLLYPYVVHLPLILLLYMLSKKFLWSLVSVLLAYLCCQLRRWIALLITTILSGDEKLQSAIQLIITLPLLVLVIYLVVPSVRKLMDQPLKLCGLFAIIPALYYVFDYSTVIYTDFLHSGNPVAAEFMPFVFCLAYLLFLVYYHNQQQKEAQHQQVQNTLSIQLNQSTREINTLRESQELTRQYRHDFRHHLQYIFQCIEDGCQEQAQQYIATICEQIDAQKVQRYCENEAANLILSAFAGRAQKLGVTMTITGRLPEKIIVSDNDLCVLLSNALENAINACKPLVAKDTDCVIDVQFYEKDEKLFLQVINPCGEEIQFYKGIPVSEHLDHGIGVQSICAIVKRYKGVYTFTLQEGKFVFRVSV